MVEKKGILLVIGILALFLTASSVRAFDYYADIEIQIGDDGSATLSGTTNHPLIQAGKTDLLTSKKGAYWLFNITLKETFSDFIFKVVLPENAEINYIRSPSQVRIAQDGDRLAVIGTGKDEPLSVQIQYTISSVPDENKLAALFAWFGIPLILIAAGILLLFLGKKRPAKQKDAISNTESPSPGYNPDTLTDRQKQILDIIKVGKGIVTQAMIERTIKIPKSSISRNIDSLVRRGIIKKERRGMSNILTLAK